MPAVQDAVRIVTLEEVEGVLRNNPSGLSYFSDEANDFPAKMGFVEPWQISRVFIHLRTLKEAGKLRRVRSAPREPRVHKQNNTQKVWKYRFEYTEIPGYFPGRNGSYLSGHFVR